MLLFIFYKHLLLYLRFLLYIYHINCIDSFICNYMFYDFNTKLIVVMDILQRTSLSVDI